MKIFLASTSLDEILWATENGLADGVVTTPAMHTPSTGGDSRAHLAEICRVTGLPVCATVGSVTSAEIYRDGRELAKISDQLLVQVPLVEDAIVAMRRLSAEGVRVVATLVFNAAQALLAAKVGASMVSTSMDQLDALGHDSSAVVRDIRAVFDGNAVECDVMAAHPRNAMQFTGCAIAGADSVAVTATVLRSLLLHPLTDRGLDQFLTDVSRSAAARRSS